MARPWCAPQEVCVTVPHRTPQRRRRTTAALATAALLAPLAPITLTAGAAGAAGPVNTAAGAERADAAPDARHRGGPGRPGRPGALPYRDARLPVEARVRDLLGRMTLEEKVGQMTQAERAAVTADPSLVAGLGLGSVLSGGGSAPTPNTPEAWADTVDALQRQALSTRLGIPLIYGVDAVHGHGNVFGATVFPHNIGLGATRDARLVEQVNAVTAEEVRATGIPWNFAPCLCVSRDARWGRSYESFGEDPELVSRLGTAAVAGLQGRGQRDLHRPERVLATVKHFAGDGGTEYGTGSGDYPIDQGVTVTSREEFERTHLAPYRPAIQRARAGSAMPSFSSVDFTDDGVGNPGKMHANRQLLTDVLKGGLGLDGFVVSDWEAIHQLPGEYADQVRAGVNAGVDVFMEPNSAPAFVEALLAEVRAGRVPQARIDDAVRRILTKKFQLGLFENPFADRTHLDEVGSAEHRAVARRAVARSQVLLQDSGRVLPLRRDAHVYVAGRSADDVGLQSGGWTLSWQGFPEANAGGVPQQPGTSILEGIREVAPGAEVTYSADGTAPVGDADVAVVAVGETPYAEGFGDVGGPLWAYDPADAGQPREQKSLELQPQDRATVERVCSRVATCVLLVVSGRPQVVTDLLDDADAVVASWLPGTEGAGVADVLFGRAPFTGKLPVSWPRTAEQEPLNVGDAGYDPLFPYGHGLSTRWRR
ncbi:glycoside hydrolase family 3 protein [Kineococcus gypseus]|uniref:glycoside hydrolase family 3 protein n=1 Tax=Kineococcus gypseus TaxID=1637102 RepID=UPI003D7C7709